MNIPIDQQNGLSMPGTTGGALFVVNPSEDHSKALAEESRARASYLNTQEKDIGYKQKINNAKYAMGGFVIGLITGLVIWLLLH